MTLAAPEGILPGGASGLLSDVLPPGRPAAAARSSDTTPPDLLPSDAVGSDATRPAALRPTARPAKAALHAASRPTTRPSDALSFAAPSSGAQRSAAPSSGAQRSAAPAIRLVATDLDGTLLRHDKRVSRGTLAALADARAAGLVVIAATGRQADQLPELIGATGINHAVASNGAIAVDLRDGRILFEDLLTVEAQAAVVDHFAATLPGVRYASVRDHGAGHLAEPGYLDLLSPNLPELPADFFESTGLAVVVSEPTLKLTARHPEVSPEELLARLQEAGLPGCHGTTSGAPFLEIQGAGVTKAAGVSRLARLLGVEPAEVMAVGDARNDVELLEWAGVGVAMGNAVPEAFAVADWTTATNEADGLALAIRWVLERRDAD